MSSEERTEILALADYALVKANRFREKWISSGDPQSWELAEACLADRKLLLNEVRRP